MPKTTIFENLIIKKSHRDREQENQYGQNRLRSHLSEGGEPLI